MLKFITTPHQFKSFSYGLFYGCSFVAKLIWKSFFWKNIFFLQNIHCLQKNVFIWKKKFYIENFFHWKKLFTEENGNKNVKIYISFKKYIFMQKMFVLQIKYKSFLNIYSFCKKLFLILKNIFAKTSLWTQQSGP